MSVLKNLSMTSGVVFFVVVAFVLSLVSAQNDLEFSPQSDLESMQEIQELLRNVQLVFEEKIASKVREGTAMGMEEEDEEEDGENGVEADPNGCSCRGLRCSCCKHIRIPKLKLNGNTCLTVSYLPRNYGILATLTYTGRRIFSKEVSARNPPPICAGAPFIPRAGSVCIQFYNLDAGKKHLRGCTRLLGRLLFVTIVKIDTGCFRINALNATQQVTEIDMPYLDEAEALAEGPNPVYIGEVPMVNVQPAGYREN